MVTIDDAQWTNYLLFRDTLRADEALRAEYAALKRTLQEQFAHNRRAYTKAKDAYVGPLLARRQPT